VYAVYCDRFNYLWKARVISFQNQQNRELPNSFRASSWVVMIISTFIEDHLCGIGAANSDIRHRYGQATANVPAMTTAPTLPVCT